MKFIGQIFIAAAVLVTCNAWGDCSSSDSSNKRCKLDNPHVTNSPAYRRVVVLAQDKVWPGPVLPIDPNHQLLIGTGLYTQADVDAMTTQGLADLLTKYGFDFSSDNPNVQINPATGMRTLPGVGILFPSILGLDKDFSVVIDTDNPSRGNNHNWYYFECGETLLFTSSGTITSGTNVGATFEAGDLYAWGDFNLLKNGANHSHPQNREVVHYTTSSLAKQSVNQWGFRQFNIAFDIFNENGKQGLYMNSTAVLKEPVVTGTNTLKSFPVLTWDCKNN